MGERMNDIRRLVRSGCLLLLPFLILSVATFAHSQERPSIFLDELTWTELRDEIATGKTTIIVPIGGTEQSGPAMALGKHNRRVKLLSERIADSLGNAIVAPVIAYVPEGNLSPPSGHMRFPGTISVPEAAFEQILEYAARSFKLHGFKDIVFLGDHGGYQANERNVANTEARRIERGAMNGKALNRHSPIPRAIWTLGFVSLLMDVSSEMVHALLPVFLVSELGASFAAVGLIEGIAKATAAITKIFSGVLSDWLGRRKALSAIGYGLSAIAKPTFPLAASIGWIVTARFVDRVRQGRSRRARRRSRAAGGTGREHGSEAGAFPAFLAVALLVVGVREPLRPTRGAPGFPLSFPELRRHGAVFWLAVATAVAFSLACLVVGFEHEVMKR